MHTASVLGLGLLVLTLEQTFRPEALYPWLGLLSGLVALGLGAYPLISRLSAWGLERKAGAADATTTRHHDHTITGTATVPAVHRHVLPEGTRRRPRDILALALAEEPPAPIALVVLLGAIEAHRVAYGLALVMAFSTGLALALIAVGMGALRAREAVARRSSSTVGPARARCSRRAPSSGWGVYLTACARPCRSSGRPARSLARRARAHRCSREPLSGPPGARLTHRASYRRGIEADLQAHEPLVGQELARRRWGSFPATSHTRYTMAAAGVGTSRPYR